MLLSHLGRSHHIPTFRNFLPPSLGATLHKKHIDTSSRLHIHSTLYMQRTYKIIFATCKFIQALRHGTKASSCLCRYMQSLSQNRCFSTPHCGLSRNHSPAVLFSVHYATCTAVPNSLHRSDSPLQHSAILYNCAT